MPLSCDIPSRGCVACRHAAFSRALGMEATIAVCYPGDAAHREGALPSRSGRRKPSLLVRGATSGRGFVRATSGRGFMVGGQSSGSRTGLPPAAMERSMAMHTSWVR
jgi:hypothetical protein